MGILGKFWFQMFRNQMQCVKQSIVMSRLLLDSKESPDKITLFIDRQVFMWELLLSVEWVIRV